MIAGLDVYDRGRDEALTVTRILDKLRGKPPSCSSCIKIGRNVLKDVCSGNGRNSQVDAVSKGGILSDHVQAARCGFWFSNGCVVMQKVSVCRTRGAVFILYTLIRALMNATRQFGINRSFFNFEGKHH